ncbi:Exonuclease 3'-5' domain-containing protein 1 [Tupaia chinensis]|uniref:Exonuclease 3'-5' domain-containing protein 1 n=1 Tax=Tupaia chinensis TaxID=246437 RepID=L9JCW1_TUPCH|nr:Exonuclease 3'-5' domain-containing protein 1 [Tupaia chinensis]
MDLSSDYQFLNQILWRRVRLTLVCGIFEGVLQHVDPNKIVILKKEEEEVTYTVIDQFQQKFGAAVATNSRVYLFDIFLLGSRAFNNGLQMILEDKRILKVIHDCRWLSDCLSHQYGILLNNVFDTQENPEVWFTRPLSPSLLKILALETTYLLPLRLVLLDEMMSDLTTLVDGYLNTYREGSADQLGSTKSTCMELPKELLQLQDFQKQRRERAAKEYSVSAQGLLIRTVLHPKALATEAAGEQEKVRGFTFCTNSRVDKPPSIFSHKFHENVNLLKEESKNKQPTTEPQHLPLIKEGKTSEESSDSLTCPESEGQRVTQKEHSAVPTHKRQASLSLKVEIEQLLMVENKDDLKCTNQDLSLPPSLPRETQVSPHDNFHSLRKAVFATLPPCPALERTDSWINPSLNFS